MVDAYVDDYICVDVESEITDSNGRVWPSSAQWALSELHDLVGLGLAAEKHKPAASKNVLLGVEADLSEFVSKQAISFSPTKERKGEILHDLRTCQAQDKMTPRQAASFMGRLAFTLSTAYASVGRAAIHPLVDQSRARYESKGPSRFKPNRWTPSMTHMIAFFTELFLHFPPLTFDISKRKRPKVVVYTDASFSDKRNGIGIILLDEETHQTWVCETACPKSIMEVWNSPETNPWLLGIFDSKEPNKTHINALELLAILGAVWTFGEVFFKDRQVVFFCDNTSALSAVINGYAKSPHLAALSNALHLRLASLRCDCWFEWVPSTANCSDVPSRPQGPGEVLFYEVLGNLPWSDGTKGTGCRRWQGGTLFPSINELRTPRYFNSA